MEVLDHRATEQARRDLPGWIHQGDQLVKTFVCDDFHSAALFAARVATAAEAVTRHPDIGIHGNEVALALTTDTAGTLTADEVALARRIQRVAGGHHHPVGLAGS